MGSQVENTVFKHLLLATDGSAASSAIVHKCIAFAKAAGAALTGVHVIAPFHVLAPHAGMLESSREQYQRESELQARRYLDEIRLAANEQGVRCKTLACNDEHPYEAIIRTAREQGCDMICMASHGRRGIKGVLLGSETQKVLTHSQIPVLVFR